MAQTNKDIKWINCAKLIAILAVLIDHSEMILYDNTSIAIGTYFSVTLFIFISGMMCYYSDSRHNLTYGKSVSKMIMGILPAYLTAMFLYEVISYKSFDFLTYFNHVIYFNFYAHFYYVALYIQLALVNIILYRLLLKIEGKFIYLWEVLIGIVLLVFAAFSIKFTNILYIYGGGGKLLGGTYLFVFYLGMLAMKHNVFKTRSNLVYAVLCVASFVCVIAWWRFECRNMYAIDARLPFGDGINPPGLSTFIMAMLVCIFCYAFFSLFEGIKITAPIIKYCSLLGRHTLYIYLYHKLILDQLLMPHIQIGNIWIKRCVYMILMITVSIAIEYIIKNIKVFIFSKNIDNNTGAEA